MKDKDSPSTSVKDALGILEGLEHLRALISQASREIDQMTRECDVGALALHFYNAPEPKTVEFLKKHGIEWIAPRNGHGFSLVFPNRSALNAFYEQGGLIAVAQVVTTAPISGFLGANRLLNLMLLITTSINGKHSAPLITSGDDLYHPATDVPKPSGSR